MNDSFSPTQIEGFDEATLNEATLAQDFLEQAGVTERLNRAGTTDVAINQPFGLWTDGPEGWLFEPAPWLDFNLCWKVANSLAALNHRDLSALSPIHTVELPDGERGQIVMPPACERRTLSMTFRKPSLIRFSHMDYVNSGRYDKALAVSAARTELAQWQQKMKAAHRAGEWDHFMRMAVDHRQNIIIFGGPGSGKTTYGKALVDLFPTNRRMVTIQEMLEDQMPLHPNHVHLLYGGHVTPKSLVASSLRMKPDHLFLAEITGDEVWHYIEMLNTGTRGTVCTAHANDAEAGFARVCGLIKQSPVGIGLDYSYIDRLVRSSFDVVVYMEKTEILEVHYEPDNKLALLNAKHGG
ncbi:P-type DNA transfer ATPase VirB11 (plasmid) [Pseudomonas orientalis]|uniref:P-type DNA transfer ATPase VirB11 n=1 Tax=Pseudomonas orientalis TaxID=76758 RepID=UPI0039866C59